MLTYFYVVGMRVMLVGIDVSRGCQTAAAEQLPAASEPRCSAPTLGGACALNHAPVW